MHKTPEQRLAMLENAYQLMLAGCWQWNSADDQFYFTDALFALFGLDVPFNNLIFLEEVNAHIHADERDYVKKKWEELKAEKKIDFYFRIVTPANETRHLHFVGSTLNDENGEKVTQGYCKDVTGERETARVLKDYADDLDLQLKTYRRAEQIALTGTWQIDLNTHDTFYSDNTYRLYGLGPQTIKPHLNTFAAFIHPDDKAVVVDASEAAYRFKIPLHLEYRIIRNDGEMRYVRVVSDVTKGLTGEELLTGIIQDITEQKQLELQLRSSNASLDIQNQHFRQTEQIALTGTWQLNLETREAYYSDNLYRLYGLKPYATAKGVEGFMQYIYSEDRDKVRAASRKTYEDAEPPNMYFRIVRHDGKLRYMHQAATLLKNTEGEPVMIGVIRDVTEQQLLSGKLEELNKELTIQNEAFTQAEQTAHIGTWRWNLDTNHIFYSDNIYRLYGLKPQSVQPGFDAFNKYFHPDDLANMKDIPAIMQKEGKPVQVEYRIYRADGELRHVRGRNRLYISEAGERIMIGTTQDVTEEVLMQYKLDDQVRFVRLLSDNLVDQVMVTNTSNLIIEFNKAAEKVQGISREDVIGKNFFEAFPQSKLPNIIENFKKALKGEVVHEANITLPLSPGFIERYHIPVKDEQGNVVGVLTVIRDVTKESTLRNQLQNRLSFIESLVDASLTRIIALDKDLNYTLWNNKAEKYYGLPKQKILGRNMLEFYPALKREPLYKEIKKCLQGEIVYLSPRETEKEGYHESYLVPLKDTLGDINGILWMINDLSERRQAEKEIEASRSLLQQTAEATPDCITIYDLDKKIPLYLNDRIAEWIGADKDTLIHMGIEGRLSLIHPDDRKPLLDLNTTLQGAKDNEIHTLEYRIWTKQKEYMWIRNRSKVFSRNKSGKVTHTLSILQDITEQKKSERLVSEKQHYLQQIQDTVPDMISIIELKTMKIDYLNEETFKAHGFDPANFDAKKKAYQGKIVHEDDQKTLADYFGQLSKAPDEEIAMAEYRAVDDNGVWKWFLVRGRVFQRDENGNPTHVINVIENITERKNIEMQMMRLKDEIAPHN